MKSVLQRLCAMMLSTVLLLSIIPATAMPVFAAELSGMPAGLTATYGDTGTWKIASTEPLNITGTVAGKGSCTSGSSQSTSIELKNTSGEVRGISFDYKITIVNSGTCTMDGTSVGSGTDEETSTATGKVERSLANGSAIKFDLTTAKGSKSTTSIEITNLIYTAPSAGDITFQISTGGSYSANGTAVTETTVISANEVVVAATPASGYDFVAWIDADTGRQLSTTASCTLAFSASTTVKPIFTQASMPAWYLVDGSHIFNDLSVATSKANSTIVVIHDGVLPAGDYTIPSGVTLLVPFDSVNTTYNNEPVYVEEANAGGANWSKPTFYRTLTMESGANITVNGTISLSAKHSAQFAYNGMPIGNVSRINMASNSSITVNSGGTLYAWGYITGSGNVIANSGAKIYENFIVKDWRGGSQTMGMKNDVFPMSQYYFQNIEVPLTIYSGATEYGITTASLSIVGNQRVTIELFAPSGALFNITSGSVTKDYLEGEDRLQFTINGNLLISAYTLKLSDAYKINTKDYVFPIPGHFKMHAKSGSITLNQNISFYPGSEFVIDPGATMTVGSGHKMYIYDIDQWGNYCYYGGGNVPMVALDYAPGRTCAVRTAASLKDAAFCINGSISGNVYTSEGGANVYSSGSGTVTQAASANTTIHQIIMNIDGDNDQYDAKTFVPAVLQNADTSKVSGGANTYTYTECKWVCATHTGIDTDHTCDVCGFVTECADADPKDHNCDICGEVLTECADTDGNSLCDICGANLCTHANTEEIPAVDATCTATGLTAGTKCTDCGTILTEQEEVPALGHAWDNDCDTTCNNNCGETREITHSYDDGVVTTDPTCTDAGVKTFTCGTCSVTYTEAVDALDHDWATALTEGKTQHWYACSRCDETKDAADHSYTWTIEKEANCYQDGSKNGKCACGATATEVISATGNHSYSDTYTTENGSHWKACTTSGCTAKSEEGTCADAAEKDHKCDVCKSVMSQCDFAVKGDVKDPGNCVTKAVHYAKCSICGAVSETETLIGEIDSTNHTGKTDVRNEKAATCAEEGYTGDNHCSDCNVKLESGEVVGKLTTHTYPDTWTQTKAPSCTEKGSEERVCSVCKNIETREVEMRDHTLEDMDAKAPTCTETGLTEGKKCSACGTVTVAQEEIPAVGHTAGEVVKENEVAATCDNAGSYDNVVKCSVCGAEISRETVTIDALGHEEVSHEAKAPTCTEIGWDAYVTCNRCDYTTKVEKTALGHTNGTPVKENEVKSTCNTQGSYDNVVYCTVCKEELSRDTIEVPAKGHTEGAVVVENKVAATCTDKGSYDNVVYCTVCDAELSRESVDTAALNHDLVDAAGKEETCTEDGYSAYKACSRCDYIEGKEVIPAAHKLTRVEAQAPTCTEIGWDAYETCSVCDHTTYVEKPALGHDEKSHEAKTPTCTESGWGAYVTCSRCDYSTYEEEAALGHDMVAVDGKAATCTEAGYSAYTDCSRCDHIEGKNVLAATGHVNTTSSTVQNDNGTHTTTVTCKCGHVVSDETVTCTDAGNGSCACGRVMNAQVNVDNETKTEGIWTITGTTMNVKHNLACVVLVEETDGTYTRLTATANANGGYDFDVKGIGSKKVVIAVKGDLDCDGMLEGLEAIQIGAAQMGKITTFTALQIGISDLDGDGTIEGLEAIQIGAAQMGKINLNW